MIDWYYNIYSYSFLKEKKRILTFALLPFLLYKKNKNKMKIKLIFKIDRWQCIQNSN